MRPWKDILIILLLFGTMTGAGAEKIPIGLQEVVRRSQVIVSVKVDAVSKVGGVKVAEATVLRSIVGEKPGAKLTFMADKTWGCDDSRAVVGETVLLFLQPNDHSARDTIQKSFWDQHPSFDSAYNSRYGSLPFYRIVNSGDGRLTMGVARGTTYVITKPFLPSGLPNFPHAGSKQYGIYAVRFADMIAYIQKVRALPPKVSVLPRG